MSLRTGLERDRIDVVKGTVDWWREEWERGCYDGKRYSEYLRRCVREREIVGLIGANKT